MIRSFFQEIAPSPPDPIFGVANLYNNCTIEQKQLLAIGVCLDDERQMIVFYAISRAEDKIIHKFNKDYLPMAGYRPFIDLARSLL
jgi:aspartate/tyrosine/aromatic aminotransferase